MAARTALSFLKGRLPTIGRFYTRSSAANIAAESSWRRIIKPVAQLISKRETETEIERALRTGDAFVKHRLLEKYLPVSSTVNEKVGLFDNDKPIFIGRLGSDDEWLTAFSLKYNGNLLQKFHLYPPYSEFRYFHSTCFGVFCFICERSILLWNPTTNESKILPPCDSDALDYPGIFVGLICEVWVDDKSQDYKVARLNEWHYDTVSVADDKIEFLLYSLKTDSWKKIPCPGFLSLGASKALINGVFYVSSAHREAAGSVILAFDFSTETISYIPLPFSNGIPYTILDYNGLLSIISSTERSQGTGEMFHEHWVMRNGSWCKLYFFHTCNVVDCRPLGFSKNCESLFFKSLNGHQLLVFDCVIGRLKHFNHDIVELIPYSKGFVKLSGAGHQD